MCAFSVTKHSYTGGLIIPLHMKSRSSHPLSHRIPFFQDCDFPEDALLPEIRPESQINVMEFLNIKRADDSKLTP
jgi:hypothetical protein